MATVQTDVLMAKLKPDETAYSRSSTAALADSARQNGWQGHHEYRRDATCNFLLVTAGYTIYDSSPPKPNGYCYILVGCLGLEFRLEKNQLVVRKILQFTLKLTYLYVSKGIGIYPPSH